MPSKIISVRRIGVLLLTAGLLLTASELTNSRTKKTRRARSRAAKPAPRPIPTVTPTPTPTPTTTPTTPPLDKVRVTEVYKLGHVDDKNLNERNSAGLQDIIVVKVHDLESLAKTAKCLSHDDRPVLKCHEQAIMLFLEGRQIKGIVQ